MALLDRGGAGRRAGAGGQHRRRLDPCPPAFFDVMRPALSEARIAPKIVDGRPVAGTWVGTFHFDAFVPSPPPPPTRSDTLWRVAPHPLYPKALRRRRDLPDVERKVRFKIDEQGRVFETTALSCPEPYLSEVVAAAAYAPFEPQIAEGQPVQARFTQGFVFRGRGARGRDGPRAPARPRPAPPRTPSAAPGC